MITVTMRHWKQHGLDQVWSALGSAWHNVTSRAVWKAECEAFGVGGWVRLVEGTHGSEFGWHLHIHALVFLEGLRSDATVDALGNLMFGRWASGLVDAGMPTPIADQGGLEAHLVTGDAGDDLSSYFTKAVYEGPDAAALEVARGDLKDAHYGNRTPFAILRAVYEDGDADDLGLWHEWESVSKGKRMITWSRGLRDRLLLEVERSDADIVDEDIGTVQDTLCTFDAETWAQILAARQEVTLLVLARVDDDGAAVFAQLAAWGHHYELASG